jgi:hypothetical protein
MELLAFLSGGRVEVANGYRERVGRVGRLWNLIQIQKARHHLLHLMFFSAAISDHGGLDREWRIFSYFKSG